MIIKDRVFVVTGGYGFLGGSLIEDIIKKNGKVRTIGRNADKLIELKNKFGDSIEIIVGDIKDIFILLLALNKSA